MLFNSLQYAIFLPLVVLCYFLLPVFFRSFCLLIASFAFYMSWNPHYAALLCYSILLDYSVGLCLKNVEGRLLRLLFLLISLVGNLGLLFVFKYGGFFQNLAGFGGSGLFSQFILPVGISFYTFQTIGYTIDVYRRKVQAEANLIRFALYVSFFPQLVAGPVERASNLLPQLSLKKPWCIERVSSGVMLILWGLMKKAVIADRIAPAVDMVYASPSDYSSFECWLATMLFMVQIYCDFSGYTDMAIGSARIFGVNLMKNFHRPWLASSLSEFWNRWHISLSSWFYDYVYSPVASFSFMHPSLWYAALLLTFLCSGFWHGASFTFIAWGAYNGFCLILESQVISPRRFKRSVWGILVTQFLMIISWVLFRAQTIPQALEIYYRMFIPENFTISSLGLSAFDWIVAMLFLCLMIFAESYYEEGWMIGTRSAFGSLFFGAIFVMVIWVFGVFGGSQFLYFQF